METYKKERTNVIARRLREVKKSDVIASAAKQPLNGLVKLSRGCFSLLAMTSLFLAMH
jgi:hypothetical protein